LSRFVAEAADHLTIARSQQLPRDVHVGRRAGEVVDAETVANAVGRLVNT
jgi:hypothetical protein